MISEEEAGTYCPQCRREWTIQKSPFSGNKFIHCVHCKESAEKILKKADLKQKVSTAFKNGDDDYDALLKQYELFLDGWDDDIFFKEGEIVKLRGECTENAVFILPEGYEIDDDIFLSERRVTKWKI